MSGQPDANDVLRNHGEEAVRNGFDRARAFDPSDHDSDTKGEQPTHEPINPVDAATLLQTAPPERVWHVADRIPGDDVTLLGADGGEGKTTLALQLAYCTTLGFPWIGFNVRRGSAIYFTAEEPIDEMHYRLSRLYRTIQSSAQQDRLTLVSRAGKDAVLATFRSGVAAPTALFLELVALVRREQPALVVLDAAADVFGGDEIRRADVRAFINLLRGHIAMPHKCAVLLLAHPSQEGMRTGSGYSGSTHWNNSVRSRLYLTTPGKEGADADARVLDHQKNNRGKRGEKIQLRWTDGYFSTQTPNAAVDAASLAEAKQVFLTLLRRYNKQRRTASDKVGRNYAPSLFADEEEAAGLGSDLLKRAMNALFAEGLIEVFVEGSASAKRSKIVEKEVVP